MQTIITESRGMIGSSQMPELRFVDVPGPAATSGQQRRLAYWDWMPQQGADAHRLVVCVHGLSRQGRDFDALASALTAQARVIAVDVAGRGFSDWLADPMAYQVGTYAADVGRLIARLRSEDPMLQIDWIGTSMGGLIGMALAAQAATGIRRLVLNDVGPVLQWDALRRIGTYLGLNPSFASEQEAVDYLWSISSSFGPHSQQQWMALSRPMLREREGRWWLHYDPALAVPIRALTDMDESVGRQVVADGEAALWALYDAISAPTLLLRGADSDLLTRETAKAMSERGPRARCVEFPGVGHAPTLVVPDQVAAVVGFLGQA
ncbi:alpha/beta fold hydrolase [Hydrogenophaga flava]|uniref:alpha/beta fold hydrolase n=1 Tax=Hydrogenophaga flava TaxID=65657 RepID=UPI003F721CBD